jgi:integrase
LPTRDFIALLPWFALSGFCGLRSCEAFRLDSKSDAIRWDDLYFDRGFINIREEVAKATRRSSDGRHPETPHYLAALKAWLELVPRENEFVVRWTQGKILELKREFTKATGIKLLGNGLRNSFASYALTFDGLAGVGKLALEMGNSEAVCKQYYIRTLEPGSGKAWFNLRPFGAANVISIAAAA